MKSILLLILSFLPFSSYSLSLNPTTASTKETTFDISRRKSSLLIINTISSAFIASTTLGSSVFPVSAIESNNNGNNNDDGYITTSRGLKYKVITPPINTKSSTPQRAQKVKTKYTLYVNGFPEDDDDSSSPNNKKSVKIDSTNKLFLGEQPFEFLAGVSQVIKGWDLQVIEMRVGEVRKLIIPSELGYGVKGAGGKIPGGATLYFDIELVDIGEMSKMGTEQNKWLEDNPL